MEVERRPRALQRSAARSTACPSARRQGPTARRRSASRKYPPRGNGWNGLSSGNRIRRTSRRIGLRRHSGITARNGTCKHDRRHRETCHRGDRSQTGQSAPATSDIPQSAHPLIRQTSLRRELFSKSCATEAGIRSLPCKRLVKELRPASARVATGLTLACPKHGESRQVSR